MARRPRPTYRELDSLQRRYDAVVATMRRVVEERDSLRHAEEAAYRGQRNAIDAMLRMAKERDHACIARNDAMLEVLRLRPITVSDLARILWNGIRGKGWGRRP